MAEQDQENSAIPLSALVLLATLAGSLFWVQKPLTSSRPDGFVTQNARSVGDQTVESRLWEDPLSAVERSQNNDKEAKADPANQKSRQTANFVLRFGSLSIEARMGSADGD